MRAIKELIYLAQLRARLAARSVQVFLRGSKLRVIVVSGAGAVFWLLMLGVFLDAFRFLFGSKEMAELSDILINYLFAFFFAALLVMMTISNAIICSLSSFWR